MLAGSVLLIEKQLALLGPTLEAVAHAASRNRPATVLRETERFLAEVARLRMLAQDVYAKADLRDKGVTVPLPLPLPGGGTVPRAVPATARRPRAKAKPPA